MCNDVLVKEGRLDVAEGAIFSLTCNAPDGLSGWVSWAKSGKIVKNNNLTVKITTPDGKEYVFDDPYPQGAQAFNEAWTLPGTYTITITNTGAGAVRYRLEAVLFVT